MALASFSIAGSQALRNGVSPFLGYFASRYHISYAQAGGLLSAFFLAYALFQLPSGVAADRYGARRVVLAGLLVLGVGTLLFVLSPTYGQSLVARLMTGLGGGMLYSPTVSLVANSFSRDLRGLAFGILEGSVGLGMFIPLTIFPTFFANTSPELLIGAVGGALALPFLALARPTELRLVESRPEGDKTGKASLGGVARHAEFWLLVGVGASGLFAINGGIGWLPTFLAQAAGFSAGQTGLAMAVLVIAQIAFSLLAGHWSDRLGRRIPVITIGTACMLAAVLGLTIFHNFVMLNLMAGLIGAGAALGMAPLVALISERFGTGVAASVMAAVNTAGQLSSAAAGVVDGYIFDRTGSFTLVWLLAAALLALRLRLVLWVGEGSH